MPIEETAVATVAPTTVQAQQQPIVTEAPISVIADKFNKNQSKENLHKPTGEQKNKPSVDIVASILEKSRQGKTLGSVGVWETIGENSVSNINQLATKQRRQDQEVRRMKRTSDWDAQLDAGRIKKVKKPKDPESDRMALQSKLFQQVSNERYLSK